MELIKKLKKENDDAYEKWFERWYEKENLENAIIKANQEGYKGCSIKIYNSNDKSVGVDEYTQRRLRDPKLITLLKIKLGAGLRISHEENKSSIPFFGTELHSSEENLLIRWDD